jgi:hypothetical protein
LIHGTASLRDGERVDEPALVAVRDRIELEADEVITADG